MTDNQTRAREQALAQYASILEMVTALREAEDADDSGEAAESAREAIQDDALSVQIRGGWYSPGEKAPAAEEYEILLSTGGPATRIVGQLGEWNEPETARLEYQDWFVPWSAEGTAATVDSDVLLSYVRCFYFGEG